MSKIRHAVSRSLRRPGPKFAPAQKWVVALGLLVLALGLANLARTAMALRYDALLPDLPLTVPLTYLAAMGGFWGVVLTACAVGLAHFQPWGRWGTLAATTLYEAHVWINHLLFDASDYARQTRPRDLLLTLLLLVLVWGSLNLHDVRKIFSGQSSHAAEGASSGGADDLAASASPLRGGGPATANPRGGKKEGEK